jgi:hypothetical protein
VEEVAAPPVVNQLRQLIILAEVVVVQAVMAAVMAATQALLTTLPLLL